MQGQPQEMESLRRELAELERQIEAIRRLALDLSTATEIDDLVREALNTSLALAEAEAGSILLYHPDKQKLVFEYVIGDKSAELTGVEIEPGQGLAGSVFESGRTFVSEDVAAERSHLREMGEQLGYVTRNMVTVALLSPQAEPLGVMQVLNKRNGKFEEHDVRLIETIAAQIAVAITTIRLHEQARLATVVRFIGDISHDVKNMITPPMTGAQTLRLVADRCFQDLDRCLELRSDAGGSLADVAGSVAKLRELYPSIVAMILDGCDVIQQRTAQIAAAVKGAVSEPHFERVSIVPIVERVGTMLDPVAQRKGVALRVETAAELPTAMIDGKQIYNAVYNLIFNAIDACAEGDSVVLRCRAETCGKPAGVQCIVVECADSGPGMPEHVKAKLFTDQAVSTKPMGTGLGTRIVKDVIDAHGGTIELESQIAVGTTIRCRIPMRQSADAES